MLGLTQEELAERLGVSRGAVGNWETGAGISRRHGRARADLAGVSLDWLMSDQSHVPIVFASLPTAKAEAGQAGRPALGGRAYGGIEEEWLRLVLTRLLALPHPNPLPEHVAATLAEAITRVAKAPPAPTGDEQDEARIRGTIDVLSALF